MDKFEKLLNDLQELEVSHRSISWMEDLPSDFWKENIKGKYKEVDSELDVDTHRWYETSTSVYEIHGKFLGVNHVSNVFSESMGVDDCGESIEFFEMVPITTITYKEI